MLVIFVNRKTGKAIYGTDSRNGKRQRLCDPQGEEYAAPKLFCDNECLATDMKVRGINPKHYKKVPVALMSEKELRSLGPAIEAWAKTLKLWAVSGHDIDTLIEMFTQGLMREVWTCKTRVGDDGTQKCLLCSHYFPAISEYLHCPFCGAKIGRGEQA